jgi:hypothetical protein
MPILRGGIEETGGTRSRGADLEQEAVRAPSQDWRVIEDAARSINVLAKKGEGFAAMKLAEALIHVELRGVDVAAYDAAAGGPVRELCSQVIPRLVKSLGGEEAATISAEQNLSPKFLRAVAQLLSWLLSSRSEGTLQLLEDVVIDLCAVTTSAVFEQVMTSFDMGRLLQELNAAACEGAALRCVELLNLFCRLSEHGALSRESKLSFVRSDYFEKLLGSLSDDKFSKEAFPSICSCFNVNESIYRSVR